MARPRSFDPDAVLDAATGVFHTRGYEGTSVQHLVDATGLSRSSLYGAFGDKQGLFLAVLDRYAEAGRAETEAMCCGASALDAIRAVLDRSSVEGESGCLIVNVAGERAATCPATAQRASAARRALAARFEALVTRAQTEGEVGGERDPLALAQFLTGAVYGLRALQTAGAEADELRAVRDGALAALGA